MSPRGSPKARAATRWATASALEPSYWCIHTRRQQQAGLDALLGGRITSSVADSPHHLLACLHPLRLRPHAFIPSPLHPIPGASRAQDACLAVPAAPALDLQRPASSVQRPVSSVQLLHPSSCCILPALALPAPAHGVASARAQIASAPSCPGAVLMFRDPRGSVEEERSERFTRDRMQPGEPAYQRPTTQTPLSTARPLPSPTTPSAHPQPFPHHDSHQHHPPADPRPAEQLPPLSTALYNAPKTSYYDPTSDHGLGQPHASSQARFETHYPSQVPIPAPFLMHRTRLCHKHVCPNTSAAAPI